MNTPTQSAAAPAPTQAAIQQLTYTDLQTILSQPGPVQLVDVRTLAEYMHLGHIPQARLIPVDQLPARWQEMDKTRPVVVICEHGVRSMDACHYLQHVGFAQVSNVTEGMHLWAGARSYDPPS
ncbi:MAG: rhodanese-like domain-containing protein [Candidatus Melainabacteria bacterium]